MSINTTSQPVSGLTCQQRRLIVQALAVTVGESGAHPDDLRIPAYPTSVPDLDRHIEDLLRVALQTAGLGEQDRHGVAAGLICMRCPHQFPELYCPLRARGGCVPRQAAGRIAQCLLDLLADPEATCFDD